MFCRKYSSKSYSKYGYEDEKSSIFSFPAKCGSYVKVRPSPYSGSSRLPRSRHPRAPVKHACGCNSTRVWQHSPHFIIMIRLASDCVEYLCAAAVPPGPEAVQHDWRHGMSCSLLHTAFTTPCHMACSVYQQDGMSSRMKPPDAAGPPLAWATPLSRLSGSLCADGFRWSTVWQWLIVKCAAAVHQGRPLLEEVRQD
jgi:hypothetical protein